MKNIMLIAPANAGKGTQAGLISEKYNMPHITMGGTLRERAELQDELGKYIHEKQTAGILVDDETTLKALKERLEKDDCKNGYILEGYPRTLNQLDSYKELLKELNKDFGIVINLEIPYEMLLQRMKSRLTCPKCATIYNLDYEKMRPKVDGICDVCGTKLIIRSDDTEEAFQNRYNIYANDTKPILDELEKMGILYRVDASIDRDTTFAKIEEIINDNN